MKTKTMAKGMYYVEKMNSSLTVQFFPAILHLLHMNK